MLIYRMFDKKDSLYGSGMENLKFYEMKGVSWEKKTGAFHWEPCDSIKQCEAILKGGNLVGVSAVPFSVPFVVVGIQAGKESIDVAGALTFKIIPDGTFRDFILNQGKESMSEAEFTRAFNSDVQFDIKPVLTHIFNTESSIEQIKKHGEYACDWRSSLAASLPSWCKVVGIKLDVNSGNLSRSKYAAAIAKAFNDANGKEVDDLWTKVRDYWDGLTGTIAKTWLDRIAALLKYPLKHARKGVMHIALCFVAILLCVKGCNKLIELCGGGKSNLVECSVAFEDGEKSDSSKLEKWLLENHLSDVLKVCTRGRYGSFAYGETYKLEREEVEEYKRRCDDYIRREKRGTLVCKNTHCRRDGLNEIFEIGDHSLRLAVGMESSYAPDSCRLVMEGNDAAGILAKKMQRIFLRKGNRKNDGTTEYPLLVRADQLATLFRHLENDQEIRSSLKPELHMPNPNEIRLYVNTDATPREYTLDISEIYNCREEIAFIEEVFGVNFGVQSSVKKYYRDRQISGFFNKIKSRKGLKYQIKDANIKFFVYQTDDPPPPPGIRDFWEEVEPVEYKHFVESYNKTASEFKPYTEPDAIPLMAKSSEYERLKDEIMKFDHRVDEECMKVKMFLSGFVTNKCYRAPISVPPYADEHAGNLIKVVEAYGVIKVSIKALSNSIKGNVAIQNYRGEMDRFWKMAADLDKEIGISDQRVEVLRKLDGDVRGVPQNVDELLKYLDYKEGRIKEVRKLGRDCQCYLESLLASEGVGIKYDYILGAKAVRQCQGVSASAFESFKELVEDQEKRIFRATGGGTIREFLEKYQEYAIRLSEQTEATSYLNRLKKRLASIKR